jgi:hypothetical protein
MPLPRFEVAVGAINDINTIYFVSTPYRPGTLAAFLNGQLKRADYMDGWLETNPATGQFDMKQAPETGDVVQAFFLDTSPVLPGEEITRISGTILDLSDEISGIISAPVSILGAVKPSSDLGGEILAQVGVLGGVSGVTELEGLLGVCDG